MNELINAFDRPNDLTWKGFKGWTFTENADTSFPVFAIAFADTYVLWNKYNVADNWAIIEGKLTFIGKLTA